MVIYNPEEDPQEVLNRAAAKDTCLTAWFKANQEIPEAHNHTYQDFPEHFTWHNRKEWRLHRTAQQAIG